MIAHQTRNGQPVPVEGEELRVDRLAMPGAVPKEDKKKEKKDGELTPEELEKKRKEDELLELLRARAEESYALHNDPVRLNENNRQMQERLEREKVQDRRLKRRNEALIGRGTETIEM